MPRRAVPWIIVAVVITGGAALYLLLSRPEPVDDRQQILRLIADVERAVESKRVSDLMRHISADYEDSRGYNRRMVQRLVTAGARDRAVMDLSVQVTDITVEGDTARFVAEVDYAVGRPAMPGASVHLTVSGELRRERSGWKVVGTDGRQGAEAAFFE